MKSILVPLQWHQAKALSQDLVVENRRIVMNIDILDGECRYLSDKNPTESIRYGGIKADEGKGAIIGIGEVVKFDLESLPKSAGCSLHPKSFRVTWVIYMPDVPPQIWPSPKHDLRQGSGPGSLWK